MQYRYTTERFYLSYRYLSTVMLLAVFSTGISIQTPRWTWAINHDINIGSSDCTGTYRHSVLRLNKD